MADPVAPRGRAPGGGGAAREVAVENGILGGGSARLVGWKDLTCRRNGEDRAHKGRFGRNCRRRLRGLSVRRSAGGRCSSRMGGSLGFG